MLDLRRRQFIRILGTAAAAWPLALHAQETANLTIATEPQVEIARVKAAPNGLLNPRLSDRVVALTRGVSLSGAEGFGSAWEASPYIRPADVFAERPAVLAERYGKWCSQVFPAQNRLPWYNYLTAFSPCSPNRSTE
jgi:hypothetical protein